MTPRIQKAIDIFLDAINAGTLAKGTCVACAVGNLVADGLGGTIKRRKRGRRAVPWFACDVNNQAWSMGFMTGRGRQRKITADKFRKGSVVLAAVAATEFTYDELAAIEFTFETSTKIMYDRYPEHSAEEIRADQLRGLEAVVKVMLEFDEQPDNVNEVFTQKAELIPIK